MTVAILGYLLDYFEKKVFVLVSDFRKIVEPMYTLKVCVYKGNYWKFTDSCMIGQLKQEKDPVYILLEKAELNGIKKHYKVFID